jgi:hypothetical protein
LTCSDSPDDDQPAKEEKAELRKSRRLIEAASSGTLCPVSKSERKLATAAR